MEAVDNEADFKRVEEEGDGDRKRKRGRRAGKGKNVPQGEADVEAPEPQEETAKKTRRSKKGKGVVEELIMPSIDFQEGQAPPKEDFGICDADTRSYFQTIEEIISKEGQDEEELPLLLENVYAEVNGKEMMICTDFEGSRILEKLLRISSDYQIRVFCDRLNGSFHFLFMHQFGSHVVQTLLNLAADVVEREYSTSLFKNNASPEIFDDNGLPSMESLVVDIGEQLNGHWNDLLMHAHASHVVRTLLNVLSGEALVQDSDIRSAKSKKYNKNHKNTTFSQHKRKQRSVPPTFTALLQSIVEDVSSYLQTINIRELALHPVANPVIQMLISIPTKNEKVHPLVRALLAGDDVDKFINSLIQDRVGSHLMEKIIQFADKSTFRHMYKDHFLPRFLYLCKDNIANFVMQRVIQHLHTEKQFNQVLEILAPEIENLIFACRTGIVVSLLEAAVRFPECQLPTLKLLQGAFKCTEVEKHNDFIQCVLFLYTFDKYQNKLWTPIPNVQGALMLQHILNFSPTAVKEVVDLIVTIPAETLHEWIREPITSRILEAILDSVTASNKSKRDLILKFSGSFTALAVDKYASHFLDKCWNSSNLEMKEGICAELATKESSLKANFHAKFVLRNCGVELFKVDKERWIESQKGIKKEKKTKEGKAKKMDEIDALFAVKGK